MLAFLWTKVNTADLKSPELKHLVQHDGSIWYILLTPKTIPCEQKDIYTGTLNCVRCMAWFAVFVPFFERETFQTIRKLSVLKEKFDLISLDT